MQRLGKASFVGALPVWDCESDAALGHSTSCLHHTLAHGTSTFAPALRQASFASSIRAPNHARGCQLGGKHHNCEDPGLAQVQEGKGLRGLDGAGLVALHACVIALGLHIAIRASQSSVRHVHGGMYMHVS
eukprot:1158892-Pelagomonas_calceolata.AAC.5